MSKKEDKEAIDLLINTGIPVCKAEFIHAINNADNVPESNFSSNANTKSRKAQMWWHPWGILCFQNKKYFAVYGSMIKDVKFDL